MTVARERLASQRLVGAKPAAPEAIVAWLLAVQAQEYAGALWGVGQRAQCGQSAVIAALDAGRILRTHVLRPTWHLVVPADVRWLLALTAPRIHAQLARTGVAFRRSTAAIAKAVRGTTLTRTELARVVGATGPALGFHAMHAELEQVIISGPGRTYAAFDERVPPTPPRSRVDALGELARRYFASHGPARIADLAWWSGLTIADCKRAVGDLPSRDGYFGGGELARAGSVLLLPNYDEYLIAYRERPRIAGATNLVVADGIAIGGWRREPFEAPPRAAGAIRRYRAFLAG